MRSVPFLTLTTTWSVFSAYLHHSVDTNRSEKERVSISFNIMFSAFTENLSKPLW